MKAPNIRQIGLEVCPHGANIYQKVEIFDIFWAEFSPLSLDWREISHRQADLRAPRRG